MYGHSLAGRKAHRFKAVYRSHVVNRHVNRMVNRTLQHFFNSLCCSSSILAGESSTIMGQDKFRRKSGGLQATQYDLR